LEFRERSNDSLRHVCPKGRRWSDKRWAKHLDELGGFLEPIIGPLGRAERRIAATRYVHGLLLPGERKSIEPIAGRLRVNSQSLQQFVRDSPWSAETVWSSLRREAIAPFGPFSAWVIDESGWPKQGKHSVGVARQYSRALGRTANCQICIEVAVAGSEVALPVAGRLYLPENWMRDRARRRAAGVPDDIAFQTKPQIALDLLRQVITDGVARAPILADEVYGDCHNFRASLRQLGLEYCLKASRSLKAWTEVPHLQCRQRSRYFAKDGRFTRSLHELANAFAPTQWVDVSWKAGKATCHTRLAWRRIWLANGLRCGDEEPEQAWLLVDWPARKSDPYRCYLMHLNCNPSKALCLRLSRDRSHIEKYFQRLKNDLGLHHYEGRSWQGFHHHLVLAALAYLFVGVSHHRSKKNFWADVGKRTPHDPAVRGEVHRLLRHVRI